MPTDPSAPFGLTQGERQGQSVADLQREVQQLRRQIGVLQLAGGRLQTDSSGALHYISPDGTDTTIAPG